MIMVERDEEDFPRGGVRPRTAVKRLRKDENLFSTAVHELKKQKKDIVAKETVTDDSFHSSLKIQPLSYNTIKTDMIILGCIRKILNFALEIELPGLTFCYVSITNISDPLIKYLTSKSDEGDEETLSCLSNMFKVGQFVLTKVTSIKSDDRGINVECTINPRDIYSDKLHNSFEKGLLIWAAVQSELEHGYELNNGVKNCRIFLPQKNIDKTLAVGELVWSVIHKSDSSTAASTLRVSCKSEHLKKAKIGEMTNLHDLIPGMQVEMVIEKMTNNGISGKFLNNFYGYIEQIHLHKNLSKYQEGNLVTAYVLYVDHTVKVTHLTTYDLDLDLAPSPKYKTGEIIIGEVVSKVHNGIYLKLPSKERCFVTNRRLIRSLPKQYENLDISDTVRLKFALATRHSCRILDYNNISRIYVGTVEQSIIKEKVYTVSDVKIGQLLEVTINKIKHDGLVVTAGHVRGFVSNFYLSNIKYTESIKKKFKEGLRVKARVLNVVDGNVLLTLKSGQVDSEQCLCDLSQAKRGDRYPGVIIKTTHTGALVSFYGNVQGWISKKYIGDQNEDENSDPQLFFYLGQVVNPCVLGVTSNSVILSIRQPKDFDTFGRLTIGQKIKGVVSSIRKDGIFVKTFKGRPIGIVPINHLSQSLNLCSVLLKTYSVGDKIDDLICINNTSSPNILSRREALVLKKKKSIFKTFEKLKPGNIIRCSYASANESGIYVIPMLSNYMENILIKKKDIVDDGADIPKFELHQTIVTKVLKVDHNSKKIRLTAKLSQVFNNSVESVLSLFGEHLAEIQNIEKLGKEKNWDICQYAPGERVSCYVEKLGNEGGCLVTLPNGVNGLVAPRLCPDDIKEKDTVTGVFLSQNFTEDYAEICLKKDISLRINKIQDGVIMCNSLSSCISEIILIKSDLSIALLKQKDGNRQLVYIPLFVHENDFEGCKKYYEQPKTKICVCGKVENQLIGMSKKLFVALDKQKAILDQIIALKEIKHLLQKDNISNGSSEVVTEEENSNDDAKQDEEIMAEEEECDTENTDIDEDEADDSDDDFSNKEDVYSKNLEDRKLTCSKNISFGDNTTMQFSTEDSITGPLPVVSGVNSFFATGITTYQDMSSDDEVQETTVKKKNKLTPAERAQLIKEEENRISKIEKVLADCTNAPNSAEQFDRLLVANPNSSELWTKYMAFHTAATEFDKARVVAERALETVDVTLLEERLNIWLVLLNLENMVGTKESFNKTFEEAIKCNDSLRVYLKTIEMLAESGKIIDMEEKIKKVKNKHKQNPQMWTEIAKTYYLLGKFKEARNMKDGALKSITNKIAQLDIIVKFALMEFRFGDEDYGAAIFETMLSSDPKKVTVWTTYVDQLVKKNKIDEARQVLERSLSQRLSMKKMKTLFLKFRMFEEQHGTPENVNYIIEKAKEYASKI